MTTRTVYDAVFVLRADLRAVVMAPDRVLVAGERGQHLLEGAGYRAVLGALDGVRSVRAVVAALAGEVAGAAVVFLLERLRAQGWVVEARGEAADAAGWRAAAGVTGSVGVVALGLDAGPFVAALGAVGVRARVVDAAAAASGGDAAAGWKGAAAGVGVDGAMDAGAAASGEPAASGGDAGPWVVVAGDLLDPRLAAVDEAARRAGVRWLPVRPVGTRWWVGPSLGGAGPCLGCLSDRLWHNRPVDRWLSEQGIAADPWVPPSTAASRAGAYATLAPAIARWAAGGDGFDGVLVELDVTSLAVTRHRVVRRPQCAGCGDRRMVAARAGRPVVLASRARVVGDDGGYRVVSPDETWERLRHHVSPVTGVIASLGPLAARYDDLRPVFAAVSPLCPRHPRPGGEAFRQLSMGKGRTAAQSRASALCEALERYAAVWQGDEPRTRSTARALGAAAVLPGAVQHFSAAQHARGAAVVEGGVGSAGVGSAGVGSGGVGSGGMGLGGVGLGGVGLGGVGLGGVGSAGAGSGGGSESGKSGLGGAAGVAARRVPEVYDIDTPLDWTPLWSLSHQRVRWLPTAYCYREVPWSDDRRYVINDSNGRAAGNCLEEAVLQGFLELVERDAVAIWWYNRVRRPAFDLDAFGEPYFTALRAHFDGLGWELWALDLTHDLGIPVCAALARERGRGRWCVGFGCHLDARLAVMRGLTELCQLFDPSETRREPWDAGAMPSIEYLLPGDGTRGPGDFAGVAPDDLREAVMLCVERAAGAGLETLVLDLSRPDVELAVVMVNVPGLRHFWPRFGPGRLYTVPVKMGWRAVPLAEAALNPVPLFL